MKELPIHFYQIPGSAETTMTRKELREVSTAK